MRSIFLNFIIVLCVCTIFRTKAHAEIVDGINYSFNSGYATIIAPETGKAYMGDIVIPSTISYGGKTYIVNRINEGAFKDMKDVTSISLPSTINIIGNSAFEGCYGLTSINIPAAVTFLATASFNGCTALKNLTIEDGEKTLTYSYNHYEWAKGKGIFADCPLEYVYLGRDLKYNLAIETPGSSYDGYSPFAGIATLKTVQIGSSVTQICMYCFYRCYALQNVSFPASLVIINKSAFRSSGITNALFKEGLETIGENAFQDSSLEVITIPASLKTIKEEAFTNTNIKKVALNSLSSYCSVNVGSSPFRGGNAQLYVNLENIDNLVIPDDVTTIKQSCFSFSNIKTVTIPESVTSIEVNAFYQCNKLTDINIPTSINKEITSILNGTSSLKNIYMLCHYKYVTSASFNGVPTDCNVWTLANNYHMMKTKASPRPTGIYPIGILETKNYMCGFDIILKNPMDNIPYSVNITQSDKLVTSFNSNNTGIYRVRNLNPNENYSYSIDFIYNDIPYSLVNDITTLSPKATLSAKSTNITQTITITPELDETVSNYELRINDDILTKGQKSITRNNLIPGGMYTYTGYVVINENPYKTTTESFYTQPIRVSFEYKIGPTSAEIKPTIKKEDATIVKSSFTDEGDAEIYIKTGLVPNQTYNTQYRIYYGPKTSDFINFTATFKTPQLEWDLKKVKVVSPGAAIVAAGTNISDIEPNAGFMWRKVEAPSSVPSSQSTTMVFDGMIEGYIHNFTVSSFYNVCAYYQDSNGTIYSSDWIGFDPADFSYFEPTIRTYESTDITNNSAQLIAYILRGSDEIISQGFEYWPENSKIANKKGNVLQKANVNTVEGSGQLMKVEITGLTPQTKYYARAFAKTSNGTEYGEEFSFTTLGVSGMEILEDYEFEDEIIGFYDMTGIKHNSPIKGLNIILMKSGKTYKIMNK